MIAPGMRMAGPLLVVAALLAAGGRPPCAHGAPEEKSGAKVHKSFNDLYPIEFRVRVNASIERGVRWLLSAQRGDGSWNFMTHHRHYPMGSSALAVLTLLKCGTPPDHPAVVKAFDYLRPLPLRATYSVAVLLMALDARYAPARDPFEVERVDRYGNRGGKDPCAGKISPEDLAWMERATKWMLEQQKADGYWRYPSGGFDTSNTQFALLGLHAATRCGVKISNRVWLDALRYMLDFQDKTGTPVVYKANEVRGKYRFEWTERANARGFGYVHGGGATGSMTAAGLTCLVVCQNRLWRSRGFDGTLRADTRRAVRDAMAWLQTHYAVDHNPHGHRDWTFYYLYGLERAGVLGRYRFLGLHDWYKTGAEFLFTKQDKAGWWHTGKHWEGSCFALLFLKRATSRMNAPVITPSGSKDGEMPASTKEGRAPDADTRPEPKTRTERAVMVARAIRDLEDRDPDVVFLAAIRLGHLGHLRAVAPLVRALKLHADDDVRVGAANALSRLKACDAFPALIDALTDKDQLVRYAAELALQAIGGARLKTPLSKAESHNDRVRLQKAWRAWWAENEAAVRGRLKQPVLR
jgi:hypothetical protein